VAVTGATGAPAGIAVPRRPHVVILGAGFAGLMTARKLARVAVDVTVVDRTNHHLFQPLLYQVATAALAPTDISGAIRHILRHQRNTTVLYAEAYVIDRAARTVSCRDPAGLMPDTTLSYDYLVVATGTSHSYFGHPEWERLAPGLKTVEDALEIRRRFLLAFEEAERAATPEERDAWLTFVIVGAGPTGCELAGVMQEIAYGMRDDFHLFDTRDTAVILLEAGLRVLPAYPEHLSDKATEELRDLHVDVRTSSAVTAIEPGSVHVGDHVIRTHTVFWAAGNAASPLSRCLDVPLTKNGQVIVEPDLSIPGDPNVFVIGDLASARQRDGTTLGGVAQVAMQEGRVAARNIAASVAGKPRKRFDYLNKGDLATIGRAKAVANLFGGRIQVSGRLAWWLWLLIHITYLIGFRNRLSVLLQWAYAYLTYQRGARLITRTARSAGDGRIRAPAEVSPSSTAARS
jgi:NADH dehydrogenase